MSAAEDLFWMEADDGYERWRHQPDDAEVERMMADLERAVAEAKANYRYTPVKQTRFYFRPQRELSIEELEEQAAIDEYEESGQAWADRLAARAQAKRDGLVGETRYNDRPGIDRRLFGP